MEEFIKELDEMSLDQVLERKAELEKEIREAQSKESLEGTNEKIEAITKRIAELKDLEERKAAAIAITNGTADATVKEERKENKEMPNVNFRDSLEYQKAFLRGMKTGNYAECRKVMTELAPSQNVGLNDSATIPVPTTLDTEIRNAWEDNQVLSLVKKTYMKGNVQVVFEVSATGASVHLEGGDAPAQEKIVFGSVKLVAHNVKKWITISDEAIENTTIDTVGYIYKEIAQKIAEAVEEEIITELTTAQATLDETHPGLMELEANPAEDTIMIANSLLSSKAKNLTILMNRQTKPAFVVLAMKAGYAIDVFDGLKDRIVFTDKLPVFNGTLSDGDTYMIVGDFGYGYQANMPNGNDITIKRDDLSLAEYDLIKLVGKQFVGHGIVAPKAFTRIKKVPIV